MRSKQPTLAECSRDYLEHLISELEGQASRYYPINHRFLEEARCALPTAPDYFIEHRY